MKYFFKKVLRQLGNKLTKKYKKFSKRISTQQKKGENKNAGEKLIKKLITENKNSKIKQVLGVLPLLRRFTHGSTTSKTKLVNKHGFSVGYVDGSVVGYNRDWQFPAITERHAFEKACELLPENSRIVYFGFPWATLIDKLTSNRVGDVQELSDKLFKSRPLLKRYKHVVTVCQHIYAPQLKEFFHYMGITDIFWSHAVIGQVTLPGYPNIKIHPFPLFPVNFKNAIEPENMSQWEYLFSFVGAKANEYYLTDSRNIILDNLSNDKRGIVVSRGKWHYQKIVYDYQIQKKENTIAGLIDESAEREYVGIMRNSLFSLCPSGSGPNSIRLWESIGCGSIPVVLSDTYQHPGDASLWEEATVLCGENLHEIVGLPDRLAAIAQNKSLIRQKQKAGKKLWDLYGPKYFINDVIKYVRKEN